MIMRAMLAALLAGVPAHAQSPPCLARLPSLDIPFGGSNDYVIADLDGDGEQDFMRPGGVVTSTTTMAPFGWRRGLGNARFSSIIVAGPQNLPLGYHTSITAGDIDGDGDADVVTTRANSPPLVDLLLLNDGNGTFALDSSGRLPPTQDQSVASLLFDADGDGDLDLVVGNAPAQNTLYLNDGRGFFQDVTATHMPFSSGYTGQIVAADVDGDVDVDLILGNGRRGWPNQPSELLLNDGSGKFVATSNFPPNNEMTTGVSVGDADGDGDLDVFLANYHGTPSLSNYLWFNDGRGKFTDESYRLPASARQWSDSVTFIDLDNDRDLDLVVGVSSIPRPLVFLINDGAGNLTDLTPCGSGPFVPLGMATSDFDHDGDNDILIPLGGNGTVLVSTLRQLDAPTPAVLGSNFNLDLYGNSGHVFLPAVALTSRKVPIPPYGIYYLDPATTITLPAVTIPASRQLTLTLPLPMVPLWGQTMYVQAIDLDLQNLGNSHMTNWLAEVLQ